MDFRQLQYVLAVAEERSITKAAQSLYVSQPAMSHYIQKTEEELGVLLFDRTTTPLSLTYAGEEYVKSARNILEIHSDLLKKLRDIGGNLQGRLHLGMPKDRAAFMLPLILPVFKQKYPGIEVEITTDHGDNLKELLEKGRIDFMILPFFLKEPQFETYKIHEERLLLVAKKGVLPEDAFLSPHQVDLKKLKDEHFLLLKSDHVSRKATDLLFRTLKMKPERITTLTSSSMTYRMASKGFGIAIIPEMTTKLVKLEDPVDVLELTGNPVTWDVMAVFRKEQYIGQVEKDFFSIASKVYTNLQKNS